MHLRLTPISLPQQCIRCGDQFIVKHAMTCKKGGLVTLHHNDLKAEWHHLCAQALTSLAVTDEPLIHISQDVHQVGATGAQPHPELHGDVTAHGFWKHGMTAIFDICVMDTDVASY